MGMYTELVFGGMLKEDTPKKVIDMLNYICNGVNPSSIPPSHPLFQTPRWSVLGLCDSYYFGSQSSSDLMFDNVNGQYRDWETDRKSTR